MQHQHIKKPEQTHDSDSDHNSAKQVHTEGLDVQCAGLPLYLQRSQTQWLQRQPVEEEEEELQTKCENCAIHPKVLGSEEKTLQEKSDHSAAQQHLQKGGAVQKKPLPNFLQAKLKIGAPNDKYEQEADRVADQVMRMPDLSVQRQTDEDAEEEPIQTKPIASTITPFIQRQAEPEEDEEAELKKEDEAPLQAKSLTNRSTPISSGLQNQIHSLKGTGHPLPKSERTFFESRFGTDFSGVRVHNNMQASQVAKATNARAFTLGSDVVFGDGQYSPGSHSGRKLLAHELTHVVQQNAANNKALQETPTGIFRLARNVNHNSRTFATGARPMKLSRVDASASSVLFREAIQLRSTNRVADTAIRSQDNRREEVLRLLDRLHRLWAITNANYGHQFRYIHALPRGSHVPQTGRGSWTFQPTMDAISRAREPLMAQAVITHFLRGVTVSGSVGRGGTNNKADVLKVMDRLNFITPYGSWATERSTVAAAPTPTVSAIAIPNTLAAISSFKMGIASATLGWLPVRASEREDEGDRFAGQTTSHNVTVLANHTANRARSAETRESISVSIFLPATLLANQNRVFLFFSPGNGTEVNPRVPGGNATNVHAIRSGADPAGWIVIGIPGFRAPSAERGWNTFDTAAINSCLRRAGRPIRIDRLRAAAHSRGGRGLTRTINRGLIPGGTFEQVIFLDQPHGALSGLRRGVLIDYTKGGGTGRNRHLSALGSRAIGFARLIADRSDIPAPAPARALIAALGPLPARGSFTTQPIPTGTTGRINIHTWVRSHWSAVRAIARADAAAQTEWRRFNRNPSRPLNRSIVDQSPGFHVNVEDLMRFFGRRLINSSGAPMGNGFSLGIYAHHLFVAEISEELFQ